MGCNKASSPGNQDVFWCIRSHDEDLSFN
uniref:Uncharacterized protein n=1 Tax=Rhizophora mucronata TaxID=61149 RepID=A0A2P2IJS8_RHIMU